MAIHNNNLYFISGISNSAVALHKYDGTSSEAEVIYNFNTYDNYYTNIDMISAGDFLFFKYLDPDKKYSLFRTDGTTDGITVLNNTYSHSYSSSTVSFNNKIYFNAEVEGESGNYLFVSDGTSNGTKKIKLENPSTTKISPYDFQVFNGELYLASAYNVLKLNSNGTYVKKVFSDNTFGGSNLDYGDEMTIYADSLSFVVENNDNYKKELWISNGTNNGSNKINLKLEGSFIRVPQQLTSAGNKLFFIGSHDNYGIELFVYSLDNLSNSRNINFETKNISIFPNPAQNNISFDIGGTIKSITVYDILGNVVIYKTNYSRNNLDIDFLSKGLFFIKINTSKSDYLGNFYKID